MDLQSEAINQSRYLLDLRRLIKSFIQKNEYYLLFNESGISKNVVESMEEGYYSTLPKRTHIFHSLVVLLKFFCESSRLSCSRLPESAPLTPIDTLRFPLHIYVKNYFSANKKVSFVLNLFIIIRTFVQCSCKFSIVGILEITYIRVIFTNTYD